MAAGRRLQQGERWRWRWRQWARTNFNFVSAAVCLSFYIFCELYFLGCEQVALLRSAAEPRRD